MIMAKIDFTFIMYEVLPPLATALTAFLALIAPCFKLIKKYKDELKRIQQVNADQQNKIELLLAEELKMANTLCGVQEDLKSVKTALIFNFKSRIMELSTEALKRGSISSKTFSKLNSAHEIYQEIGGNGEVTRIFQKVMGLPLEKKKKEEIEKTESL